MAVVKNLLGNNKEFLCITHTVEHSYISPRSTLELAWTRQPTALIME